MLRTTDRLNAWTAGFDSSNSRTELNLIQLLPMTKLNFLHAPRSLMNYCKQVDLVMTHLPRKHKNWPNKQNAHSAKNGTSSAITNTCKLTNCVDPSLASCVQLLSRPRLSVTDGNERKRSLQWSLGAGVLHIAGALWHAAAVNSSSSFSSLISQKHIYPFCTSHRRNSNSLVTEYLL